MGNRFLQVNPVWASLTTFLQVNSTHCFAQVPFHFAYFFCETQSLRYFFDVETMGVVCHGLYRRPWPSCARSRATHLFPASWATPGAAAARWRRVAWRRRLQRGVSSGSVVAALAERRRQRGSGAVTAGSAAAASGAGGRRRQRIGGGDGSSGSSAAAGSGAAGGGRAVVAAVDLRYLQTTRLN